MKTSHAKPRLWQPKLRLLTPRALPRVPGTHPQVSMCASLCLHLGLCPCLYVPVSLARGHPWREDVFSPCNHFLEIQSRGLIHVYCRRMEQPDSRGARSHTEPTHTPAPAPSPAKAAAPPPPPGPPKAPPGPPKAPQDGSAAPGSQASKPPPPKRKTGGIADRFLSPTPL
jgi:hypothetical protein